MSHSIKFGTFTSSFLDNRLDGSIGITGREAIFLMVNLLDRYYIKNVMSSDQLIPEDSIAELVKESQVHLLQLHAMETATQLMVEDFTIFRQIGKSLIKIGISYLYFLPVVFITLFKRIPDYKRLFLFQKRRNTSTSCSSSVRNWEPPT